MERRQRPLPDGYLRRPLIETGLQFYWTSFWELTTDRHLGFGAESRIPSAAIHLYAERHGILCPDEFEWFLGIIRAMDAEYLGLRAPPVQNPVLNEVAVTDVKGVRGLLRRLAKKPAPSC